MNKSLIWGLLSIGVFCIVFPVWSNEFIGWMDHETFGSGFLAGLLLGPVGMLFGWVGLYKKQGNKLLPLIGLILTSIEFIGIWFMDFAQR